MAVGGRYFKLLGIAGVAAVLGLTGCAGDISKATMGQVGGMTTGAVVGGVIGKQIGGQPGMIAGVLLGTAIGGMIGHEIGRSLDEKDRVIAHQRMALGLSQGRNGQAHTWTNPDNTATARYTPMESKPATVKARMLAPPNVQAVGNLDLIGEAQRAPKVADVHAGPGKQTAVVGKLASNEEVMVYGKVSGQPWYVVGRNGMMVGYVSAAALKPASGSATQPLLLFQEPKVEPPAGSTAVASDVTVNTTCRDMAYEISKSGSKVEEGTFKGCKQLDGNWVVQKQAA